MTFIPSAEQQAIFDYVLAHKDDKGMKALAIRARAGTGKTTTILQLTQKVRMNGIYCAFNKSIATEVEPKLKGSGISAKTFHSMGYGVLSKAVGASRFEPDGTKYRVLAQDWLRETPKISEYINNMYKDVKDPKDRDEYIKGMTKSVTNMLESVLDFIRYKLVAWDDVGAIRQMASDYQLDDEVIDENLCDMIASGVEPIMKQSEKALREKHSLDFTDMIYWVVRWNLSVPQYMWVLVDECQDLSPMQREMVKRSVASNGFIIAVGDDCQAIYAFAGADSDSFDLTVKMFNAHVLPLTMTRRCGKYIVEHANQLVPDFRAAPTNKDGRVVWMDENLLSSELEQGDMVLCRIKSPIVSVCLDLLAMGKPAKILGGDIGKALIKLAEKIATRRNFKFEDFELHIQAHADEQVKRLVAKGDERGAENVKDECEGLKVIANRTKPTSIDSLKREIDKLFDSERGGIILATAHKSKGLEAERVFLLKPEKFPLSYPGMSFESSRQEDNLHYVAMTRAIDTLVICTNSRFKEKEVPPPYTVFDLANYPAPYLEPTKKVAELPMVTIPEEPESDGFIEWISGDRSLEKEESKNVQPLTDLMDDDIEEVNVHEPIVEAVKVVEVVAPMPALPAPAPFVATGNLKADFANAKKHISEEIVRTLAQLTLNEAIRLRDALDIAIQQLQESAE